MADPKYSWEGCKRQKEEEEETRECDNKNIFLFIIVLLSVEQFSI